MSSIYIVYPEGGDLDGFEFVKDKKTAEYLIKLGMYDYYEEIPLLEGKLLAEKVFDYYKYLGDDLGIDRNRSDMELRKEIVQDSKGIIIFRDFE